MLHGSFSEWRKATQYGFFNVSEDFLIAPKWLSVSWKMFLEERWCDDYVTVDHFEKLQSSQIAGLQFLDQYLGWVRYRLRGESASESGYLSLQDLVQDPATFCMDIMDYIDYIDYGRYFWNRLSVYGLYLLLQNITYTVMYLQYSLENYWHSTTLFVERTRYDSMRLKVWDESIKGCLFVWAQVTLVV